MNKVFYENIGETVLSDVSKSGLRVFVIPKEGYKKTYALLATDFGSVDRHFTLEGKEVSVPDGIAHFLEHKMFEQEDGGNAFDEFAKYGANANAYTSFEMTGYLFSTAQSWESCLSHLLSYVYSPYFTDENVSKEQGIIAQEIKMYDDSPQWSVFFGMLRALYKNHPINIDIAGDCEEIAKITKETLYTCYNSYYHPKNMMLCVVGEADADRVMEIVNSEVGVYPYKKAETILPEEPSAVSEEFFERKMSVANPIFSIGFKESYPEDVVEGQAVYSVLLEYIMGKTSPLYNRLYENGDIFSLNASFNISRGCAFAEISGEGDNPEKVYDEILKEIKCFREKGFDEEEVTVLKNALYGKYIRNFNDVEEIAGFFVSYAFMGGDYLKYGDALLSVNAKKLEEVIKSGFKESALSKILPMDKAGDGE